jgi:hypothetical protein
VNAVREKQGGVRSKQLSGECLDRRIFLNAPLLMRSAFRLARMLVRAGAVKSASDREQPRQLAARYSGVRGGQEGHIRMWSRPKRGPGCFPLIVAGAALISPSILQGVLRGKNNPQLPQASFGVTSSAAGGIRVGHFVDTAQLQQLPKIPLKNDSIGTGAR